MRFKKIKTIFYEQEPDKLSRFTLSDIDGYLWLELNSNCEDYDLKFEVTEKKLKVMVTQDLLTKLNKAWLGYMETANYVPDIDNEI